MNYFKDSAESDRCEDGGTLLGEGAEKALFGVFVRKHHPMDGYVHGY